MNQKIQTIIWAILFSFGICFVAKAETRKSTSEQTAQRVVQGAVYPCSDCRPKGYLGVL